MATETKLPVAKKPSTPALFGETWRPLETLRKEVDRLFEDFGDGFWQRPFRSLSGLERSFAKSFAGTPAVDIAETEKAYEITAELPGIDQKNVEVNVANGGITIKGEKKEETEEKKKDYYVSERRYGSFQRSFQLPAGVDLDKVAATFEKGVLRITLPKTAEAVTQQKKIPVKST